VFVGVMDSYPNSDRVIRFAHEVFPLLRSASVVEELSSWAATPPRAVARLSETPGITVTGGVWRGIQNKV